jgi:predicted Holliday junction resolvase-like endonuclease
MKKVLLVVMVLVMSVLVINAQATKTTVTNAKSTKTTIQVADLQKPITDNIAKDWAGYTIKEATSVTKENAVTYHVVVVKGTATETLVYDKDGKFVKKLTKDSTKHHSGKK